MKQTEQTKFDLSLYNDEFFEWHLKHVHESSVRCMEWYCEQYDPKFVLDIGCGIGSYLLGALNKGATIRGIEISTAAREHTDCNVLPFINYADVLQGNVMVVNWECVLCFEVAEHIESQYSGELIERICKLSNGNRILFSAAPPGQDGTGHINCQPKEYWIELFAKYGRKPLESTTEHIAANWKRLGAPDYIVKNLIVL